MIEAAVAKATAVLQERIAALEAELAKAKKNSSNSSKPPSSDLVKLRDALREVLAVIYRRETMTAAGFQQGVLVQTDVWKTARIAYAAFLGSSAG